MTAIPPVDRDELPESVVKRLRTYGDLGDPDATFPRVLAHADGYAEALWDAMEKTRSATGVDPALKEIIRIQLARTAEDPYFSGLRSEVRRRQDQRAHLIDEVRGNPEPA